MAVLEIAITSIYRPACRPWSRACPWADDFTWAAVNYTPIVVGRRPDRHHHLVVRLREELVQGTEDHHRPAEGVSSADEIAAEHAGQDLHVHRDGDATPSA